MSGGARGRNGSAPWDAVLDELRSLRDERARGEDDLWDAIDELHALVLGGAADPGAGANAAAAPGLPGGAPDGRMDPRLYARLQRRFRRWVDRTVPRGARVAVAARGDDALIAFRQAEGEHFPQDGAGGWAGFYPADGTGAIAHVEWLAARGVSWLAFPASATWWLEDFPRLTRHLRGRARAVVEKEGVGVLFDLTLRDPARPGAAEVLDRLTGAWEEDGLRPSVLDWNAGPEATAALDADTVFSPPETGSTLPYLDASVDIVAVSDEARLPEAERVARRSVVLIRPGEDGTTAEVRHVDEAPPAMPPVSIVIPTFDGLRHVDPCVRGLRATLPDDFGGEVLIVDDGSGVETARGLTRLAESIPWLRIVRNEANLGFIGSCNRGASEARGRYLVFLNDDTVPLPGWLEALVGTFRDVDDAGAVGGRLVYPDGRLQEAGGVIYRDGSGANVGRGDWQADAPLYRWLRRVDYCSGALLATPRDLFERLGGFDNRYRPAYYEDTDYCFRVREAGRSVYYQPRATVVHTEGGTSGVDPDAGVKRHQVLNREVFRDRWSAVLDTHPDPPGRYSELVWHELALEEAWS